MFVKEWEFNQSTVYQQGNDLAESAEHVLNTISCHRTSFPAHKSQAEERAIGETVYHDSILLEKVSILYLVVICDRELKAVVNDP